jgi:hypothetical protein
MDCETECATDTQMEWTFHLCVHLMLWMQRVHKTQAKGKIQFYAKGEVKQDMLYELHDVASSMRSWQLLWSRNSISSMEPIHCHTITQYWSQSWITWYNETWNNFNTHFVHLRFLHIKHLCFQLAASYTRNFKSCHHLGRKKIRMTTIYQCQRVFRRYLYGGYNLQKGKTASDHGS